MCIKLKSLYFPIATENKDYLIKAAYHKGTEYTFKS